jgi:hypothetical protein
MSRKIATRYGGVLFIRSSANPAKIFSLFFSRLNPRTCIDLKPRMPPRTEQGDKIF